MEVLLLENPKTLNPAFYGFLRLRLQGPFELRLAPHLRQKQVSSKRRRCNGRVGHVLRRHCENATAQSWSLGGSSLEQPPVREY